MDLSPAHAAARAAAARLPALQASFDLLVVPDPQNPTPAVIQLLTGADPDAGTLIVTIPLAPAVGSIDEALHRINLTVPVEGQVPQGAGATVGCARVFDATGAWYGDPTVSATGGGGEIELESLDLVDGAFARITSGHLQG